MKGTVKNNLNVILNNKSSKQAIGVEACVPVCACRRDDDCDRD